jgi:CubicO group peptidase (beta-lactamase class C family)
MSFAVASLTKMFTTIVALQQLETGKIALNGTVATYVPDFTSACDFLSCYLLESTWREL